MSDDWASAVEAWKAESKALDASRARGEPLVPPPPIAPTPSAPIDYDGAADGSAIIQSLDGTFYSTGPSPTARAMGISPTLDDCDRQASMKPGEPSEVAGLAQLAAAVATRR